MYPEIHGEFPLWTLSQAIGKQGLKKHAKSSANLGVRVVIINQLEIFTVRTNGRMSIGDAPADNGQFAQQRFIANGEVVKGTNTPEKER